MTKIRRDMLSTFKTIPISGEYFDSSCYDVAKIYGKDTFLVVDKLGAKFIPKLFSMKRTIDRLAQKFSFLPDNMSDRLMQWISFIVPNHLPKRMEEYHQKYKLHFINAPKLHYEKRR